ncbi:MAG: Endonuclease/exonuclease/phosphatase [Planctomycetota bacterium]|nr:Endonuclease/exonuclease/phosphatase [Planctomycetota bacterium]
MPRRAPNRDLERLIRLLLDFLGLGRSRAGSLPGLRGLSRLQRLILTLALGLGVMIVGWLVAHSPARPRLIPGSSAPRRADGYLFCSWNVENFYDDRDDPANPDEDENWFGRDPDAFAQKVRALSDAVLLHNGGYGPDILALVEVESLRAMEALRDALNARLATEWQYTGIVQRDNPTGRKFGPAVLTRLAIRDDLTRGAREFGGRRILEAHLEADGAPLVVLASHWTSRLRGDSTIDKRAKYAEAIYGRFLQLHRDDPAVDLVLSGDFNDEPDDPSLRDELHTVSDPGLVREDDPQPNLLDLVTTLDPRGEGTYYLNGRWEILDHIVAAPGLLDPKGWLVRPETLEVGRFPELIRGRAGSPWKFGGPRSTGARGVSDHLALSVRLKVAN